MELIIYFKFPDFPEFTYSHILLHKRAIHYLLPSPIDL